MKKFVIIALSCLLFLCSCSNDSSPYKNQEIIYMNYNNITNNCRYWLTTDSICYLKDNLIQNYFMVDKNSKTKIGINGGYGDGQIQRYEDKIYMLHTSATIDENNVEFELKCYDVNSKKTEKVCSIKNCDNFLVLNGSIYYLEYTWNEFGALELKSFSINTKEHNKISGNIVSFGVIDDSLYYVAEESNNMIVFRYDDENGMSVKCGDFSTNEFSSKTTDILTITTSYTKSNIFFLQTNSNDETIIYKYSFKQNTFSQRTVNGYIDGFVSYDTNSYFITSTEKSENSELYKLNNATDETTKLSEFKGSGDLFVGSDTGAYVLRNNDNKIVYYSNDSIEQIIYQF